MFDKELLSVVTELLSNPFTSPLHMPTEMAPSGGLALAAASLALQQTQDPFKGISIDTLLPDKEFEEVVGLNKAAIKTLLADQGLPDKFSLPLALLFHILTSTSSTGPFPIEVNEGQKQKAIGEITTALKYKATRNIIFPKEKEVKEIEAAFKRKVGFPGVLGLLSHTRVYHNDGDFIFQSVVGPDLRFRDVFISNTPATPRDIFQTSLLFHEINGHKKVVPQGYHLLGGPQLPTLSWLVTPFSDESTLSSEEVQFNLLHSQAMSLALEAITTLFKRFPGLRRSPLPPFLIPDLLMSAILLHNRMLQLEAASR